MNAQSSRIHTSIPKRKEKERRSGKNMIIKTHKSHSELTRKARESSFQYSKSFLKDKKQLLDQEIMGEKRIERNKIRTS